MLAMSKLIYADFAAATPTDPRVVRAMVPYQTEIFGNPSSAHQFGLKASTAVNSATEVVANFLRTKPSEIISVSCGSESNNLAIIGVAKANKNRGRHIITSSIEHPSVMNACRALEKDGWKITYLPVTKDGLVEASQLKRALKKETVLVSVHLANSELGVIQDVAVLARIAKNAGAYFHSDACQAASYLDLNVADLGADLLTFNGSKMYGPKGIAVLYVREGVQIFPILYGGGQQQSLRSGTENVAGIVGLAAACQITAKRRRRDAERIGKLRDYLQKKLARLRCIVNIKNAPRLPNHLSVVLSTSETDIVRALDRRGVAVSSGSACSSRSLVESHVLRAIGLTGEQASKTLRISLGRQTTMAEIEQISLAINQLND